MMAKQRVLKEEAEKYFHIHSERWGMTLNDEDLLFSHCLSNLFDEG